MSADDHTAKQSFNLNPKIMREKMDAIEMIKEGMISG